MRSLRAFLMSRSPPPPSPSARSRLAVRPGPWPPPRSGRSRRPSTRRPRPRTRPTARWPACQPPDRPTPGRSAPLMNTKAPRRAAGRAPLNGARWTQRDPSPSLPVSRPGLNAVDDLSPASAWAVGTSFSRGIGATPAGPDADRALERDPVVDRAQPEPGHRHPRVTATLLTSITGTGRNDPWAARWDNNEATQTIQLLFEHWNGTAWTAATSPTPVRSRPVRLGHHRHQPRQRVGRRHGRNPRVEQPVRALERESMVAGPHPRTHLRRPMPRTCSPASAATAPATCWPPDSADNVSGHNFRVPYVPAPGRRQAGHDQGSQPRALTAARRTASGYCRRPTPGPSARPRRATGLSSP